MPRREKSLTDFEYYTLLRDYVKERIYNQGLNVSELAEQWAPTLGLRLETTRQVFSNARNGSGVVLRQGDVKKKISVVLRALNTPADSHIVRATERFFGFEYNPNLEQVDPETRTYHFTENEREVILGLIEDKLTGVDRTRLDNEVRVVSNNLLEKLNNNGQK